MCSNLRLLNPLILLRTKEVMLQIDADNVIVDNSWLWRADHEETGQLVRWQNPCQERETWQPSQLENTVGHRRTYLL